MDGDGVDNGEDPDVDGDGIANIYDRDYTNDRPLPRQQNRPASASTFHNSLCPVYYLRLRRLRGSGGRVRSSSVTATGAPVAGTSSLAHQRIPIVTRRRKDSMRQTSWKWPRVVQSCARRSSLESPGDDLFAAARRHFDERMRVIHQKRCAGKSHHASRSLASRG